MACNHNHVTPLPVRRVAEFQPQPPQAKWLINQLWLQNGVGLLGGQAKVCKTYLAAELSLAVATGLPALGQFKVYSQGPVLFFGAEDSPQSLRARFDGLSAARGCDIETLPLYLIDVPVLRLDRDDERARLCAAIDLCKPRLLVLDPFVRLVGSIDENSAQDVSSVLGNLRAIQRDHHLAILLVHHARKSPASTPYQAYRGSSDFAAWSDSNLFLMRKNNSLTLHAEHRSARSPEPINLKLEHEPAPHLICLAAQQSTSESVHLTSLCEAIRAQLQRTDRPMSTTELQNHLRCRRSHVVEAAALLQQHNIIYRTKNGLQLCSNAQQATAQAP